MLEHDDRLETIRSFALAHLVAMLRTPPISFRVARLRVAHLVARRRSRSVRTRVPNPELFGPCSLSEFIRLRLLIALSATGTIAPL